MHKYFANTSQNLLNRFILFMKYRIWKSQAITMASLNETVVRCGGNDENYTLLVPNPIEESEIHNDTVPGMEETIDNSPSQGPSKFDDFRKPTKCGHSFEQDKCPELIIFTFAKKFVALEKVNDEQVSITVIFFPSSECTERMVINVNINVINLDYFLERVERCNNRQELDDGNAISDASDEQASTTSETSSDPSSDDSKNKSTKKPSKEYPSLRGKITKINQWVKGTGLTPDLKMTIQTLHQYNFADWLDDRAINDYMKLLSNHFPNVLVLDTFFWPKLKTHGYEGVKEWNKDDDIFNFNPAHNGIKSILVPIHEDNHWTLSVIQHKNEKIKYFDSRRENLDIANLTFSNLKGYVKQRVFHNTGFKPDLGEWETECVENIPKQNGDNDCGVFICMYAERIARNKPLANAFTEDHMRYFRMRMIYELCTGEILLVD